MRPRGWLAAILSVSLLASACTTRGELLEPTTSSPPNSTASPTASTAPARPTMTWAAPSTDPAAMAVATLRARQAGTQPIIIAGVASPADRSAMRQLDRLVVVASDGAGARLARSTRATVATSTRRIDDLGGELMAIVRAAIAAGHPGPTTVRVLDSSDPTEVNSLVAGLGPHELVLAVDGDLRGSKEVADVARRAVDAGFRVAAADEADSDQLETMLAGLTVPGGGQLLGGKRFIALYGTPGTRSLGVLGEQAVEATHERAVQIAEPYADGELPIVPVFEIIAAVASAGATEDGDYSYPVDRERLRAWVDYAAAHDILVVLDIQPGRTDFLTHAKQFEEFLVQPHVGLGLDPEWRLKANQVHLKQIGTVDGAEVEQVVQWLAALVRQHDLPQKMLVMHQFRASMITNRDRVTTPDELLVVLHMDGQGSQGAKQASWEALIEEGQPWAPGWKNFYDEDLPMADAARVLALRPQPVFISFQ